MGEPCSRVLLAASNPFPDPCDSFVVADDWIRKVSTASGFSVRYRGKNLRDRCRVDKKRSELGLKEGEDFRLEHFDFVCTSVYVHVSWYVRKLTRSHGPPPCASARMNAITAAIDTPANESTTTRRTCD